MRSLAVLPSLFLSLAATAANVADAPIGVFDSGVGGLTVLEQLLTLDRVDNVTGMPGPDGVPDLQGESFVQLADMANLHYGSYAAAGPDGVAFLRELSIRDAFFLLSDGYFRTAAERVPRGRKTPAKIIVIACNTATAYGLSGIEASLAAVASPVRVIGVVNAGSRSALERCGAGPEAKPFAIGVLSTPGTDASGIYPRTIAAEAARMGMRTAPRVVTRGCGNLADAIQFGRSEAAGIARRYFRELVVELESSGSTERLRAVIFGCTHYPFMRKAFETALQEMRADPKLSPYIDDAFSFVDPGVETAAECRAVLASEGLLANRSGESQVAAFVSVPCADLPAGRIGKDGTLEDGYKYSRKPGRDIVDTKFVPLDAGLSDRERFNRVIEPLPAVRRRLLGHENTGR